MEHYLIPIIQKKPSSIIIYVRTNDFNNFLSRTVPDKLKILVKDSLPTCKVFTSIPTLRIDDGKTQTTVSHSTYKTYFATKN